MNLTIMKRVRFCAGHRLLGHGGKCEFFHGHNYVAEFYVSGEEVDSVGRIIDFSVLKTRLKGWIDEHWDHGFLLNQQDENGIRALGMVVPPRPYILPYNPTAENMARYLLEEVCPKLLDDVAVQVTKVVLWETEDSFAEASLDRSGLVTGKSVAPASNALCGAEKPEA
jgi:6-pyruvoyltetrahydropterin/6-carboxytetrahydropterin synthase